LIAGRVEEIYDREVIETKRQGGWKSGYVARLLLIPTDVSYEWDFFRVFMKPLARWEPQRDWICYLGPGGELDGYIFYNINVLPNGFYEADSTPWSQADGYAIKSPAGKRPPCGDYVTAYFSVKDGELDQVFQDKDSIMKKMRSVNAYTTKTAIQSAQVAKKRRKEKNPKPSMREYVTTQQRDLV